MERKVWTFFYGSYMNRDVLKQVELEPDSFEVARLDGFEITIAPLANLVEADGATVYGVLARATQAELERLYAHAERVLGGVYRPEAVRSRRATAPGGPPSATSPRACRRGRRRAPTCSAS